MLQKCVGDLEFAEQHAENLMLDLNSMKQTHAAEMQALVVEHTERRESSLRALRADLEEQLALNVAAKQRELQEAEKVWRAQREALVSARDASDAQVAQLRADLAAVQATLGETTQRAHKDLADQKSSSDAAIQRMREELAAESMRVTQDLQTAHAVEMNRILDEHTQQEQLRRASLLQDVEDRQSKEMQDLLEAQRIDLEGQHELALSAALTDHDREHELSMKAAADEYRKQAEEARDAADRQAAEMESSRLELSALLSEERDHVQRLETARTQDQEEHANEIADVTRQLEDSAKQLQATRDECSQLQTAVEEQASVVEELKTSLTAKQARLDKLSTRNAALEADVNRLTVASVAVETELVESKAEALLAAQALQATHAAEIARILDEKRQEEARLIAAQAAAAVALEQQQRAYEDRHAEDTEAAEHAYQLQLKQELLGLEEQLSAAHATALAAKETLHQQHLIAVEEEHEQRVSSLRRDMVT